jgi:serine palmitoyltransferase
MLLVPCVLVRCVFRYRLCVEESYALGVLGETGRGACEAAGLQPGQVEVVVASMGTTLASVGGFCVGHHEVGQQRLLLHAGAARLLLQRKE